MPLNLRKPINSVALTITTKGKNVILKLSVDGHFQGSTTGSPFNGEPLTMKTALGVAERYMKELREE